MPTMITAATHIGIGMMNMNKIVRWGKFNANRITTAEMPPDAPSTADGPTGNLGDRPDESRHDDRHQIEHQELARSISVLHIATEEPQAEHVEHDMPQVVRVVKKP